MIQEAELVGDNAEEVDADITCGYIKREPLRLVHMLNPYVIVNSETSVLVTNEEGPSAPMTCPLADVSAPTERYLDPGLATELSNIFERFPNSEIANICNRFPYSKVCINLLEM